MHNGLAHQALEFLVTFVPWIVVFPSGLRLSHLSAL